MAEKSKQILISELKDAYAASLGMETSSKLIDEAIIEVGLPFEKMYPVEDILKICRALRSKPGFIGIIAGVLQSQYEKR